MDKHSWKEDAACKGMDTNVFFDVYEENEEVRPAVEDICFNCPVMRQCFAVGISQKQTGVWGGIYLDNGKISREFNRHRSKKDWANTWQKITTE
jgi:hypothetical protein